jgi:hypothetical protein
MKSLKEILIESRNKKKLIPAGLFLNVNGSHANESNSEKETSLKEDSEVYDPVKHKRQLIRTGNSLNKYLNDSFQGNAQDGSVRENINRLESNHDQSIEDHPNKPELEKYTKSSTPLNKALFNRETTGKKLTPKQQSFSNGLDNIIGDHTLDKDTALYHGTYFDPRTVAQNGVLRSPGYLSTSLHPRTSLSFSRLIDDDTGEVMDHHENEVSAVENGRATIQRGGNYTRHMIRIVAPAGTPGVAPGNHSKYDGEYEFLFGRNRNIRLTGDREEFTRKGYRAEDGNVANVKTIVHHAVLE